MARSFLFPPSDADSATTRLIALAAQATGFMKGTPGDPLDGWYRPGANNSAILLALRNELAQAFPGQGSPFWAVRLWTNLIWQPAYLAVIAVHLHGAVPDLLGLSQARRGIFIDGYRLRPAPFQTGETKAMIHQAAAQLGPMFETLLAEINTLERLRPLPAGRLLADRMLSLMVWLGSRRRELDARALLNLSELWLGALDLTGQGQLEILSGSDGRSHAVVRRKGCCLDYLIDPDRLCASCPRQPEAVRQARQLRNAEAEIG
jgi:siderophore ferric iron reductase